MNPLQSMDAWVPPPAPTAVATNTPTPTVTPTATSAHTADGSADSEKDSAQGMPQTCKTQTGEVRLSHGLYAGAWEVQEEASLIQS